MRERGRPFSGQHSIKGQAYARSRTYSETGSQVLVVRAPFGSIGGAYQRKSKNSLANVECKALFDDLGTDGKDLSGYFVSRDEWVC